MHSIQRRLPFALFFLSGFCGLLYQVVWLRLAFGSFGVITPVLSVIISVFMLGLAIGSWVGGSYVKKIAKNSPLYLYAGAEAIIGIGAFVVPLIFARMSQSLLGMGEMDSAAYLLTSGLLIASAILPWCILMGATFPFMMAHFKQSVSQESNSFSFLYLANVIGAMVGILLTALVLIESLGFTNTLLIAGLTNFLIAVMAIWLAKRPDTVNTVYEETIAPSTPLIEKNESAILITSILFVTGFTSMGLEVVWTRAFTPVLHTTVYAFAYLVAVYLFATWVGSYFYRRDITRNSVRSNGYLMAILAVAAFLPIVINDPRWNSNSKILLASIFPFCAILGYLTPKLIDQYSRGFPASGGKAYAINILGCLLGPLVASYLLLPMVGAKFSMLILAIPFTIYLAIYWPQIRHNPRFSWSVGGAVALLLVSATFYNLSYEERFKSIDFANEGVIRRDHTATIASLGTGMGKQLYVNGVSITHLTPVTKLMAHIPLGLLKEKPKSALVVCLGMGTTFRSLMSWPIEATAVELVPSVKEAFPYYFSDAKEIMKDPRGKIVVDDGRRYLSRTREQFDVITIDPPPPIEAAGSSLLYSKDFYTTVKERLRPGGILAQWFPGGEESIRQAVVQALTDSFPYVRAFQSADRWGYHFFASMTPIEIPPADRLIERLPATARLDLNEWTMNESLTQMVERVFAAEAPIKSLLPQSSSIVITDDRPYNEYFKVRRFMARMVRNYRKHILGEAL